MAVVENGTIFTRFADGTTAIETIGDGLFVVDSHYANRIEFLVEDGGGENTVQEIGFEFSTGFGSYWHYAVYRGTVDKIINGITRTFSKYVYKVPYQVLNAVRNLPDKSIKVFFRQVYGDNILTNDGVAFTSVSQLTGLFDPTSDDNLGKVAYVVDGANTGFYQVEDDVWTKQDGSFTIFGQQKSYYLGVINVQSSLSNPQGVIPIVITETEQFMIELTSLGFRMDNLETLYGDLNDNTVQEVEDTNTIDLELEVGDVDGKKLKADLKISQDGDNIIEVVADGVKVAQITSEQFLQFVTENKEDIQEILEISTILNLLDLDSPK